MIISQATSAELELAPIERSSYSFQQLAGTVQISETNEPFVDQDKLVEAGFAVEPFWQTSQDIEGECYLSYIKRHPEFEMSIRQGAYERLLKAQALLPQDWQMVIKAGFRPIEVQWAVLEAFISKSRSDNASWSEWQHLEHARLFVADPRLICPPHTTGGAVDVEVRNKASGISVDMGCLVNTDDELSFLHSDRLNDSQRQNRVRLLNAMLEAGFAPNAREWWHYQYGEAYWAAFYDHPQTLYSTVG